MVGQPAVLGDKAMHLSAVRAEQADGKLPDMREALQIGMDAADDIATGGGAREDESTHRTHPAKRMMLNYADNDAPMQRAVCTFGNNSA
jgi:hypothetical protein